MGFAGRRLALKGLAKGGEMYCSPAGITREDLDAVAKVGDEAMETREFSMAVRAFLALEVLSPGRPDITLRLAKAEAGAGQSEQAVETLTRYLETEALLPPKSVVEALRLRAQLLEPNRSTAAARDRQAADALERWSQSRGVQP